MRVSVRHRTSYRYDVPVRLAPHILRLTPRAQVLGSCWHTLSVQPQPSARREGWDAFGNRIETVEFVGSTRELSIESRAELGTLMPPPLLEPSWALPWWSNDDLFVYRQELAPDPGVQRFASELAAQAQGQGVRFLDLLAHTLRQRTDQQSRLSGDAQPAAQTLLERRGSCRDLTVLFLAACRSLGIACRFTSGYALPFDNLDVPRELHAWAEVFVPGHGFRGWDPAQGARVLDAHVPLCAAPTQHATMPVEGGYSFSGQVLNSTLDFDLRITRLPG